MPGGGGGNTTSTVHQSNLPEYAKPYYESLMGRAHAESTRPYQPYDDQRLAGQSQATTQGLQMANQFATSGAGDLDSARDLAGIVGSEALGYQGYNPANFTDQQMGFGQGGLDRVNTQNFGAAQANQYMSPFMEDVIGVSQREAMTNAQREEVMRNQQAATAGAFGGSRAAVQQQIARSDAQNLISDIGVKGRQSAFENAQQQFERDRSARLTADQQNQQTALSFGQSNQQADLEAQRLGEQSRQFGSDLGLKGLSLAGEQSKNLADMQQQRDQMMLQRIQAQLGIGQTQEDYRQEQLDMAYDDFVNQRDAQRQNLQFYSSLLQGVPVSANQNVTQTGVGNPLAGAAGTLTGLQALYALGRT